jgi:hypothetical protein
MNAAIARPLANPWIWLGIGLLSCLAAALFSLGELSSPVFQAFAVVIGLSLAGIGLTIRLNSAAPPFADAYPGARPALLLALAVFQAGVALMVSWSVLAAFIGVDPLMPSRTDMFHPPPLRPALAIILWLVVAPMCLLGAKRTFAHLTRREPWTAPLETGALLMLAAGATFLGGMALVSHAETMSFFLSVLTALLAALVSYAVSPQTVQRRVLSAAILLHFLAIFNATMAAPPAPWIFGQLWTRFSRPYLEFMYLNNAYHFYSPEPGPASYVWFRVFYKNKRDIDPRTGNPKLVGHWVKIPDLKEDGSHGNLVSLEYQRHLSLTENVIQSDPPPPFFVTGANGTKVPAPFFEARIFNSPDAAQLPVEIIGRPGQREFILPVPFQPQIPPELQYQKPNAFSKGHLETYVRHVAKMPHPMHPEWPVEGIKVYRVTHTLPSSVQFAQGLPPNDPELYRPYYVGHYHPDGTLHNPNEPLLYWLLPMMREGAGFNAPVVSYAHQHADDPKCVYYPLKKEWAESEQARGEGQK